MSQPIPSRPEVIDRSTGRVYPQAGPGRRWWPRIIDTALVLACTAASATAGAIAGPDPAEGALVGLLVGYIGALAIFGALYGGGIGVGQLLCGAKSRRTRDGRRVGVWRGICRYVGVAFAPLLIWMLFSGGDPGAIGWHDNIVVTRRGTGQAPAQHPSAGCPVPHRPGAPYGAGQLRAGANHDPIPPHGRPGQAPHRYG